MKPVFLVGNLVGSLVLAAAVCAVLNVSTTSSQARSRKSHHQPEPTSGLPAVTIALAGDSTVAPHGGWGPGFAQWLLPKAKLVNGAKGGRSSKSFRNEGWWKKVEEAKPDWILIQFGHNDQPGKGPDRETDPKTTFPANIKRYVTEARAIGAQPILVTPLARRIFGPNGKIVSDLTPYADAMKRVAAQEHVPLVHLQQRSIEQLNALGPIAAAAFNHLPDSNLQAQNGQDSAPDLTHLSEKGCEATARLVVNEIRKVAPPLARYLRAVPVNIKG